MGVKVLTVIGTRPEAIKLFPLIHALEADPRFESRVCVTGQHRDMVDRVLIMAGVKPHYELPSPRSDRTLDQLLTAVLCGLDEVFAAERPDWVVVQGDTTSALAAAIGAHHRRLRVAHVEAGLRTGDPFNPWPEETNRKLITAIASLHFAPTESAAAQLLSEDVAGDRVHLTGNTGIDALRWVSDHSRRIGPGRIVRDLQARFEGRRMILVTLHRRESIGPVMENMSRALVRLAARSDTSLVIPMHPNGLVRKTLLEHLSGLQNVALIEPLEYVDFVQLLTVSYLVLTDSGGIQEEAPAIGKPVFVLRQATERPEGVSAGAARLVGTGLPQIVSAVTRVLDDESAYASMSGTRSLYGDGRASQRIVEILAAVDCAQV